MTKRGIILQILLMLIFMPCSLSAHGDHEPLTYKDFLGKATFDVSIIVDEKEPVEGELLDERWKEIPEKDKKIVKQTDNFIIVSFYNREEKRTLYLLLTIHVEYLGANFSGSFEGI